MMTMVAYISVFTLSVLTLVLIKISLGYNPIRPMIHNTGHIIKITNRETNLGDYVFHTIYPIPVSIGTNGYWKLIVNSEDVAN